MEINNHIKISKILQPEISKPKGNLFSIIWITGTAEEILIDDILYKDISNVMLFLAPKYQWKVLKGLSNRSRGYIMYISEKLLSEPSLSKLQINELRVLHSDTVHKTQLAPYMEIRVRTLLEMLDELLTTQLNHKEEAIIALLTTLFIYCDGQCNIKSAIDTHNSKSALVYKYKTLLSEEINRIHDVNQYADMLNVTPKYLNECVQEVLDMNAKSLIIEQLEMHARRALKHTDKSIKEISFELGFSSPDYFSSFCNKHIGSSPSAYRNS